MNYSPDPVSRDLVLQSQPTADTCVHACLGMVCGIDVAEVRKRYSPNHEPIFWDEVPGILKGNGVGSIRYASCWLPRDRVFMVSVPSLNLAGRLHAIVIVTHAETLDIYDPNQLKEGVKSYGIDCDITGYEDVIEVFPFIVEAVSVSKAEAK